MLTPESAEWVAEYEAHENDKWALVHKDYWKGQEDYMGLKVDDTSGGSFRQAPVGSFVARCYRIIDLGTQDNRNPKYGPARKVILDFELPTETLEIDGIEKPFTISQWYTASLGEKAFLRRDLQSWRGRNFTREELDGFDLKNVLCKPCMVSIAKSDKGNSYIASIAAVPKGMEVPAQFNSEVFFSLEDYNAAQFNELPEGLQKIIEKSPEHRHAIGMGGTEPDPHVGDLEEDIPF